jgi:hypothetical protein
MARKAGDVFRNNLEERIGTEEYERIGKDGQQDPSAKGKWTGREVIAEFRQNGDRTVDNGGNDMVNHFKQIQADGGKFNNKAQNYLKKYGFEFGEKAGGEVAEKPVATPSAPTQGGTTGGNNSPVQSGTTYGDNSPVQNQNTNGGAATAIGGDNYGNIDNSIDNSRTYGGDTRIFNGSGGSKTYNTDVSDATKAGFYGVNDSPAGRQMFLDQYIDSNNLAQKDHRADYDARTDTDYKAQADRMNQFNPQAMQERIDREPLINRDRAKVQFSKLWGDTDNPNYGWDWEPTAERDPIESNVEEIADGYRQDLK